MLPPTPASDEVVDEVRALRHEHAAAHGFDLERIFSDLKAKEDAAGVPTVTLTPRPRRAPAGQAPEVH